jgi:cytochrome b
MNDAADVAQARPVRVWDLPTRAFHWALALAIVALVISGHVGGNALVWHMRFGLGVLALLAFRLVWGLVGGRWSRFASFIYAPATVLRYLRGEHRPGDHFEVGHNPLGSFSVFAMIGLLTLQVATGLIADDEIATVGPLNRFVSTALGLQATGWHKGPGQWLLIALVATHLMAIVVYQRKGRSLVRPMIVGDKHLPGAVPPSQDSVATRALALLLVMLCGALAAWVGRLGG